MKKKLIIFVMFIFLINAFSWGDQKKDTTPSLFFSPQIDLFGYVATESPFDVFPHMGFGLDAKITKRFSLGWHIFYSQWSDYLGLYCGRYDFEVLRPSLELIYSLQVQNKTLNLIGGIGFSYNFVSIENELCNECPEDLGNHMSVSPFIGYYLYLIDSQSGLIKSSCISVRLSTKCYIILNGDFSGFQVMSGLGFGFK
ncbi:MAG: hypothetical protein ACOC6P_00810 [Candidatus Aminicenantaceae bacterium]